MGGLREIHPEIFGAWRCRFCNGGRRAGRSFPGAWALGVLWLGMLLSGCVQNPAAGLGMDHLGRFFDVGAFPKGNAVTRLEPGEVARVELPRWVADDEALVALVHSVVLSECDKGDGYPMILSEAHERAVIRAKEKEVFYQMMEHTLRGVGRPLATSAKATSKRTPFG